MRSADGRGEERDEEARERRERIALVVSTAVFVLGWIAARLWALPPILPTAWMALAAAVPMIGIVRQAGEELRDRTMGENVLLTIAVVAAFAVGEATDGALVVLLFAYGEWLEDGATARSRETVAALGAIAPDTAWRIGADGTAQEVAATEIAVGDRVLIPPYARVPVDGTVERGESEVDTAALTGESLPVAVRQGDALRSGTVNGAGELVLCADRVCAESTAARILRLVEESAERKAGAERFITRFARRYTPVVTGLAVLVAVVPPLCGQAWRVWIFRALTFLVASCPCALVISIPLGFYAGIAAAARQGMLIKGGCFVEPLARMRAIAFDKTGTLTEEALTVTRIQTAPGVDPPEALRLAAALEQHSTHPAARAIVAATTGALPSVTDLREYPGVGVYGVQDGVPVACGGHRIGEIVNGGVGGFPDATVLLWRDGRVIAAFTMGATVRAHTRETVAALQAAGMHTVMLTGDRAAAAETVAREAGIGDDAVLAELLPEQKSEQVRRLQAAGLCTAFVGDGINDAPVLATADVGIAMGLGSPAAIETADAVLIGDDLRALLRGYRVCRRVMRIVRENIGLAIGVKIAVLGLAVCGLAPMWLAVFADMGVTLLSILNVARLLRRN